tara:strand:+ start:145 stop:549 length:405 start_codon:yes stop_codon:yes gene_type:complete
MKKNKLKLSDEVLEMIARQSVYEEDCIENRAKTLAITPRSLIGMITSFLSRNKHLKIHDQSVIDEAFALLDDKKNKTSMKAVAKKLGISSKYLRRVRESHMKSNSASYKRKEKENSYQIEKPVFLIPRQNYKNY